MEAAYSPTKEAARDRNTLHLEIQSIKREAMKSDGRLHLDRRAKRLLRMLHGLYDASMTGKRADATEIRLRLLLIRRRRAKLARLMLLPGAGWIVAFVLFLFGVVPFFIASLFSLLILLVVALDARVICQHSRAVQNIRAARTRGLKLVKNI